MPFWISVSRSSSLPLTATSSGRIQSEFVAKPASQLVARYIGELDIEHDCLRPMCISQLKGFCAE